MGIVAHTAPVVTRAVCLPLYVPSTPEDSPKCTCGSFLSLS